MSLLNNRGAFLIEVLVASVIGVIVTYGLSKSLVHLYNESQSIKAENKREKLFDYILGVIENNCTNVFNNPTNVDIDGDGSTSNDPQDNLKEVIKTGGSFDMKKLPNSNIDFTSANFLRTYGLKSGGYNLLRMTCNSCGAYSGTQTKTWLLKLYTSYGNQISQNQIDLAIEHNSIKVSDCSLQRISGGGSGGGGQYVITENNKLKTTATQNTAKELYATTNTTDSRSPRTGGNSFFGFEAGESNTGTHNTFIGYQAGNNITSGHQNIIIGAHAGVNVAAGASRKFIVGATFDRGAGSIQNRSHWIEGEITTTTLKVKGQQVKYNSSSKKYKKEIEVFKNYEEALKDLLEAPLYTFKYTDKGSYPDKKRMGIVSEYLPHHLQLPFEEKHSVPDWESVYGSLIASVKVLYQEIQDLKELFKDFVSKTEFEKEVTDLKKEIASLKEQSINLRGELKREVIDLKKETADLKTENRTQIQGFKTENDKLKLEIKTLKEELEKLEQEFYQKDPN